MNNGNWLGRKVVLPSLNGQWVLERVEIILEGHNNSSRLVGQSSPLFQIILTYFTSISVIPPKLTLFFIHFQFLLFVAWVCVLKYFDINIRIRLTKNRQQNSLEESRSFPGWWLFLWRWHLWWVSTSFVLGLHAGHWRQVTIPFFFPWPPLW